MEIVKTFTKKWKCWSDTYRTVDMVVLACVEDGKGYFMCNGCEDMNGSDLCTKCRQAALKAFSENLP